MFRAGRRLLVLFWLLLLFGFYLAGRLFWLQVVQGPFWAAKAERQRMRRIPVAAPRGEILDCKGRLLVGSKTIFALYAVPAETRTVGGLTERLARVLQKPAILLSRRLSRRASMVWLAKKLTSNQVKILRTMHIPGIGIVPNVERTYPAGDLAAQVLGFTGSDNQGLDGLELSYEKYLAGTPGWIGVPYDARNRRLVDAETAYRPPRPGDTLILTLDETVQRLAQRSLRQAMAETGAKRGTIIVMNPRTGAVLAMADWPTYDPAAYREASPVERRNLAVVDDLPPGSTFKPVTVAAALASGAVTPGSRFYDPGFIKVDGATIHCWKAGGHGSEDLAQVVANSCNVGFVEMGLRLGVGRFYHYLRALGIDQRTGIDLPGEARPIIPPEKKVKAVDLATMAFGQTLALTPIGLLRAVATIANGGQLVRPHLVAKIISPSGHTVFENTGRPVRRAIGREAAAEVGAMLAGVVEKGTGQKARVPGFTVGGKTGTAQMVVGGRYQEGKYIASFVGFAPWPRPNLAALIDIEEPVGMYYGGQVAAPVFSRLMRDLFAYEDRRGALGPGAFRLPNFVGMPLGEAQEVAARMKIRIRTVGMGETVEEQVPPAGALKPAGTEILLFVAKRTHTLPKTG